jgi:hypothetical protein
LARRAKNKDAELGETLVSLLLPIGRLMLKGGLGVADFVRAGKEAYVRAAIAYVMPPTARLNVSRLSVVTGLTRKEVATILNGIRGVEAARHVEFKQQRALRVLQGWKLDPRFCTKGGRPSVLPLRGDRRSFGALVRIYGGDVTPNSVLKELERIDAVTFDGYQRVRLRSSRLGAKSIDHMAELARLFPDFAYTVSSQHAKIGRPIYFGFKDSFVDSPGEAAKFQRSFSNRAVIMLQGVEQWVASQNKTRQPKSDFGPEKCRVGIGVYLVQGNGDPNLSKLKETVGTRARSVRAKSHRAP